MTLEGIGFGKTEKDVLFYVRTRDGLMKLDRKSFFDMCVDDASSKRSRDSLLTLAHKKLRPILDSTIKDMNRLMSNQRKTRRRERRLKRERERDAKTIKEISDLFAKNGSTDRSNKIVPFFFGTNLEDISDELSRMTRPNDVRDMEDRIFELEVENTRLSSSCDSIFS